ncbi:MAG: amino acid transporter ATPase [Nocardioidaceae bacterium]|nr:amino acid transporter ATPase [Nocardioidaceae bacterium]
MSDMQLEVEDVTVQYGGIRALTGVSLNVAAGEVVALLGANGAGKSSLLRAITGQERKATGAVRLAGTEITRFTPHAVAHAGIAHVPEGRAILMPMSVEENLLVAIHAPRRNTPREAAEALEESYALFPRLKERRRQVSGLLSGGEQQMLAIARGLAMNPLVLLLDEPSMGLAPVVIDEVYAVLKNRQGRLRDVGILLAEQSANLALAVSARAYVLSRGECVFSGPVDQLDADVTVQAYLGSA